MKRFASFFLILFLLTTTSFALEIAGNTEVEAFRCLNIEQDIYITNKENTQATVSIAVDGSFTEYIKFSELTFQLAAEETKKITVYYGVPCETKEGAYDLNIHIYTAETDEILAQTITIYTPDDLVMSITPPAQEITPCGIAKYEISINNQINLEESYNLKIDAFEEEHSLEGKFTIEPYSERLIELTLSPDDCKKHGKFNFNLIANTQYTNLTKIIPLELTIKSYGILDISPGIDRIRTNYEAKEAGITVKNLGDKEVVYDIEIDGPSWIKLANNEIVLSADEEEEANINLIFEPAETTEEGEYDLNLKLTRKNTNTAYEKQFTIHLKEFSIFARKPALIYVPLIIIILVVLAVAGAYFFRKSNSYKELKKKLAKQKAKRNALMQKRKEKHSKQKLRRLQQKDAKRKKKLEQKIKRKEAKIQRKLKKKEAKEKKEKAKLQQKKEKEAKQRKKELEEIKAKEKAKKELKQSITNKIKSQFKLIPKTNIQKSVGMTKKYQWIIMLIIALLLVVLFRLYGLIIILVYVAVLIFFEIKNINNFVRKWKFLEKGSEVLLKTKWRTGIRSFNLSALKNIENISLFIKRTKTKVEDLKEYIGFVLTENIENTIKLTNAKLAVSKNWLKRNNISVDHVKLIKRTKDGWKSQPITFSRADKHFYYFTAENLKAGEYMIAGKITPKSKKKKINIMWIAVIGLIALFAIQPIMSFKGIPPQVWTKDTQHNLNLGDYFHDPDKERLEFTADEMNNINVVFDSNKAIFTPKAGWIGQEYTIIHATDPYEETATSNPIKLIVKENVFFEKGIKWVNVIILALLLFLVVLVLFEKKTKKSE